MRIIFLLVPVILCSIHPVHAVTNSVSHLSNGPAVLRDSIVLMSLGDSMTQGTMNATNNATNTLNAYMQKVYTSLKRVAQVRFSQPLLDYRERRLMPFSVPTNLGVDGADLFSLEGKEYYKRSGTDASFVTRNYLCNKILPSRFTDLYDTVLYPINLLAWKPVSQLDASLWLLSQMTHTAHPSMPVVILWIGNNDSSLASLGLGSVNPAFIPLPLDLIEQHLRPTLSALLRSREDRALLSFEPYRTSSITRNLTEADDFADQYRHILSRLLTGVSHDAPTPEVFLCTLPYYSAVGYLMDSDDIEYYLRQVDPGYSVPPTFKRASDPGKPVTNFVQGDRISLVTFLCMYLLLTEGHSADFVNQALERNGEQRDGLVLAEDEQHYIMDRIDSYNATIRAMASGSNLPVHLIDTGRVLNEVLTGTRPLTINDRVFNRKWGRGNSFSCDGVHPGYTAHALIANLIIEHLNQQLGLEAPLYDLSLVAEDDPYVDKDEDGWVEGPDYHTSGFGELLLSFTDPDDNDPTAVPAVPPDVWQRITTIFFEEFIL